MPFIGIVQIRRTVTHDVNLERGVAVVLGCQLSACCRQLVRVSEVRF